MTLERILLQTIRFDLQVEHPYSYLIKYAKSLKGIFMRVSIQSIYLLDLFTRIFSNRR
jgi:hypothetical protein